VRPGRGPRAVDAASRIDEIVDLTLREMPRGETHGSHSVPDLIDAIQAYVAAHNENPKPFHWTATADQILEKVRRGRATLDAIPS